MRHNAQFLLAALLAAGPVLQASEPRPAASPLAGPAPATQLATPSTPQGDAHPTQARTDELPDVDLTILLDRGANRLGRQGQFALLERRAAQGHGFDNYLLGTLYRLGDEHPTELVERDPDRAETHLRQAALGGQVWAMAGLAESLLMEGKPQEALLWAHVFGHYRRVYGHFAGWPAAQRSPYDDHLLRRCIAEVDRSSLDRDSMQSELDEFQARHDAGIRTGMIRGLQNVAEEEARKPQNRLERQPASGKDIRVGPLSEPGWALYRIGVDREGKVQQVQLIDFAPHPRFGRRFRGAARGLRYNSSANADPLRRALLPIELDRSP